MTAKIAVREDIVRAAEELAAVEPDRQHWKSAQERMNELFDQWKSEQRTPPRLSKSQEDPSGNDSARLAAPLNGTGRLSSFAVTKKQLRLKSQRRADC